MSAFNTSTNTGSTTFTNAYNTAELLPSAEVQKASGFVRTSGWRYFEQRIDVQGGDISRLFVGIGTPTGGALDANYLWGGADTKTAVVGSTFNPPAPYTPTAYSHSFTICDGATYMFAVDLTGQGRRQDGVVIQTTVTDGSGGLLMPLVIAVGKNGVWPGKHIKTFARPSYGLPMQAVPWVARDSTSGARAKVSLRVVSTSFAYPVPAGMVAWGDGPEGTIIAPDDYALTWDPLIVNRGSLSGGNLYCLFTSTGENPTVGYVMSTNLSGLTGKRYMEVLPTTFAPPSSLQHEVGLLDAAALTNTSGDVTKGLNALFYKGLNNGWRRGVQIDASLTNESLPAFQTGSSALSSFGFGMMIDFDNKLVWYCQPYALSGSGFFSSWVGNHSLTTYTTGPNPYSLGVKSSVKGIPISITAASSVMRLALKEMLRTVGGVVTFFINGGQLPFGTYPLLPGAKSMNGGRSVAPGQGDSWDAVNMGPSITYGAAGLSAFKLAAINGVAQGAQVKSSGKQYFEIHLEQDWNGSGWYVGMRREAATTMSHATVLNRIDQALVVQPLSGGGARWRYGVNIGSWTATASYLGALGPSMAPWHGVAVDFDLGQMWVGQWNSNERVMHWGASSNPATGLNPHFTFTANERLRIFVSDGTSTLRRINLVQDDKNVVGLPAGFVTWGSTAPTSATATPSPSPSAVSAAGVRNIWPTGVMS